MKEAIDQPEAPAKRWSFRSLFGFGKATSADSPESAESSESVDLAPSPEAGEAEGMSRAPSQEASPSVHESPEPWEASVEAASRSDEESEEPREDFRSRIANVLAEVDAELDLPAEVISDSEQEAIPSPAIQVEREILACTESPRDDLAIETAFPVDSTEPTQLGQQLPLTSASETLEGLEISACDGIVGVPDDAMTPPVKTSSDDIEAFMLKDVDAIVAAYLASHDKRHAGANAPIEPLASPTVVGGSCQLRCHNEPTVCVETILEDIGIQDVEPVNMERPQKNVAQEGHVGGAVAEPAYIGDHEIDDLDLVDLPTAPRSTPMRSKWRLW